MGGLDRVEEMLARGDEVAGVFCKPEKPDEKPDALRAAAQAAGLKVMSAADAAKWADFVMVLTPDEGQGDLYRDDLGPNMRPGSALAFGNVIGSPFSNSGVVMTKMINSTNARSNSGVMLISLSVTRCVRWEKRFISQAGTRED